MRRFFLTVFFLLLLAAAALGAAGWWGWRKIHQPYRGYPEDEVRVVVEPGMGNSAILARLDRAGVIFDRRLARLYLQFVLDDPPLRAGEYVFHEPLTVPQVLHKLIRGEVATFPLTLIEGLTLEETADALARQGFGDRERFLDAMRSPGPISALDPYATDLEGYLYPDTYHFAHGTPEDDIVDTLVHTFRERWRDQVEPLLRHMSPGPAADDPKPEGAEPSTPAEPLPSVHEASVREIVTLASVVEKEARLDDERPVIAGVYRNRLQRGIALYADPTVIYALKRQGRWDGNLRRPDLQVDSPYNTYRYPGLPPGPIASPGLASLKAAAAPAQVPYLFFVSRNDGSHAFAVTLREHNQNVEKWQRQYWRDRWAEERRQGKDGSGGRRR